MNDLLRELSPRQLLPALKMLVLLLLIGAGWYFVKETHLGAAIRDYGWIRLKIAESGPWGGLVFVAGGALATVAGLPRMMLAFIGGVVFGALMGFVWAMLAALLGAAAMFYLARFLGRDFILPRLPEKVRSRGESLREHAFLTVLAIRIFPLGHNTLTNLVAGISTVRFTPFILASMVGFLPHTIVFAMMGSGIRKASLLQSGLGVVLFLASLLIMWLVVRRIRAAGA